MKVTRKVAVLVDGGFYRYRAQSIWGDRTPKERADELHKYCMLHLHSSYEERVLYRIFYYDCPPVGTNIYHPFLKKQIPLGKTELFTWTNDFFEELKRKRKLALRLGRLAEEQAKYVLKYETLKDICNGKRAFEELTENDFRLDMTQKGVDMKIGVDISSMTFKKQVDQIVLIAGDSDFVPAAKCARREGIEFILDSMEAPIKADLHEHIDGWKTYVNRKKPQKDDVSGNDSHLDE